MRRLLLVSWVLAGCSDGGGVGHLADAPPPPLADAAVDAAGDVASDAPADIASDAPADAAALPVTLTVTRNGAPVARVHVYFQNADSSLVATADTDAAGTASAIMVAGGFVTALDPFRVPPPPTGGIGSNNDLRTFAGVKPGDHLVLTRTDRQDITVTVVVPADPNASSYEIRTTCGSGLISTGGGSASAVVAPSKVIALHDCHGMADVLVVANDRNGVRLSALYRASQVASDGGTIDLSDGTLSPLGDVMFSYTNAPESNGSLDLKHTLVTTLGALGFPFQDTVGLESGSGSITLEEPTITGTIGVIDTTLSSSRSLHDVVDWGRVSAAYALDMTGLLLPSFIGDPSYDQEMKQVSWSEDTPAATPDLTTARIDVSQSQSERVFHWTIAAPYTRSAIQFPTLPTDIADWTPGVDDVVSPRSVMNAKVVSGGYDAVRAHVLDIRDANDTSANNTSTSDLSGFVTGPTGRVVIIQSQQLPRSPGRRR